MRQEKMIFTKELSGKDAGRILDNVLEACGMPPCSVPFEAVEERVRERKKVSGQAMAKYDIVNMLSK